MSAPARPPEGSAPSLGEDVAQRQQASPVGAIDGETRERLIDEFRACLESIETPADDAAPTVDLFTLLAEMASLKNEVRLESRQFKGTLEELRKFAEALNTHTQRLERDLERAREESAAIERRTERGLLLGLVDLRDRLQGGVDAASRPPAAILARLVPGPVRFAASLAEGQRLTLQRLDDLLEANGVRPLSVVGSALDPNCMRVVGVEDAGDVATGTVLRETRRGFFHRGEILRIAEVIVSKREGST